METSDKNKVVPSRIDDQFTRVKEVQRKEWCQSDSRERGGNEGANVADKQERANRKL